MTMRHTGRATRRAMAAVALAAGLAFGASTAFGDEAMEENAAVIDFGPAVGAPLAADITGVDQDGEVRAFDDLVGEEGVVVFFFRSVEWCPYCQAQLIAINGRVDDFRARGYAVAALSYDSVDDLATFAARRDISFTLLSDPESAVIDGLGLRDPTVGEDHRRYGIPFPTTLAVDPNRVVRAKFFNEGGLGAMRGYRARVSLDDILSALDALTELDEVADAAAP